VKCSDVNLYFSCFVQLMSSYNFFFFRLTALTVINKDENVRIIPVIVEYNT